jgi:WD40 repeat protein
MRSLPVAFLILLLWPVANTAWGAAPPGRPSPQVLELIEQLGDEQVSVRRRAMQKLEALDEDVLGVVRGLARRHPDVDVRLRLLVVARAIQSRHWGLVKAMGLGAALTASPWGGGYWLNRVKFSRDGRYAVAAGGALILYDLATGKEVRRVLEIGGARPALAVARDGKHVLTGHANASTFQLVSMPTLKTVQTFSPLVGGILAVALSPDGRRAASAGGDGTFRLWDTKTGKELALFTDFVGYPRCVAFSPDGKQLLTGQAGAKANGLVRLFDVKTKKLIRAFEGHEGTVVGLSFLPGGRRAVSAGSDGTVRLWDLASGKEARRMSHGGAVNDLAVSPDGKRALTAGFGDRLVKLWDLTSGKPVYTFDGHVGSVLGVGFSPDGRQALSSDSVCCVRLWKLGK